MNRLSRLSFLKSAGAAAGVAAVTSSPAVAAAIDPGAVETSPSVPVPKEPVVAILRDASLGEVTVLVGTTETTYRDKLLAKRLLKAAQKNAARAHRDGGVA